MAISALEILNDFPCKMFVSGKSHNKANIYLHVWGLFPTSGWINPKLVLREPRPGTEPPLADRFAELDFLADPPLQGSIVFNALTPMLCEAIIELPYIVHGVRVHGQNNFQERFVRFANRLPNEPIQEGNDFVPIPWLIIKGGGDLGG